jgi:hypothetical protein
MSGRPSTSVNATASLRTYQAGEPNVRQLKRSAVVTPSTTVWREPARLIASTLPASRAAKWRGKLSSWHLTAKRFKWRRTPV